MAKSWNRSVWWRQNFGALVPSLDDEDNPRWRGESCLTPIDERSSVTFPSKIEDEHKCNVENYQRRNLHGFTTAELIALNAITDEDLRPSNLKGDLHSLIARENWGQTVPRKAFLVSGQAARRKVSVVWEAKDDLLWDAIGPSLQLVTRFLNNAHLFPFMDALLHPELENILKEEIWPHWNGRFRTSEAVESYRPLYRFRLRSAEKFSRIDAARECQDHLLKMVKKVRLGIFDGRCSGPRECYLSDQPLDGSVLHLGLTEGPFQHPNGIICTYVSWQVIRPLLRDDLTSSMRLAEQFQVALTILHELIHCIRFIKIPECEDGPDPYFENERLAEVGWAFENAIFGQRINEIVQSDRQSTKSQSSGMPSPGFVMSSWPRERDRDLCPGPMLFEPIDQQVRRDHDYHIPVDDDAATWVVPMSYIEEIQQEDFWTYLVPKWGASIIKVYPLITKSLSENRLDDKGMLISREDKFNLLPTTLFRPQRELWEDWAQSIDVSMLLCMDEDQKMVYRLTKERLEKANRLTKSFARWKKGQREDSSPEDQPAVPGTNKGIQKSTTIAGIGTSMSLNRVKKVRDRGNSMSRGRRNTTTGGPKGIDRERGLIVGSSNITGNRGIKKEKFAAWTIWSTALRLIKWL